MNLCTFESVEFICTEDSKKSQKVVHFVKSPSNFVRSIFGNFTLGSMGVCMAVDAVCM